MCFLSDVIFSNWKKLDKIEVERGLAIGKSRQKVLQRDEMLRLMSDWNYFINYNLICDWYYFHDLLPECCYCALSTYCPSILFIMLLLHLLSTKYNWCNITVAITIAINYNCFINVLIILLIINITCSSVGGCVMLNNDWICNLGVFHSELTNSWISEIFDVWQPTSRIIIMFKYEIIHNCVGDFL